jgi:hypothetical protein
MGFIYISIISDDEKNYWLASNFNLGGGAIFFYFTLGGGVRHILVASSFSFCSKYLFKNN